MEEFCQCLLRVRVCNTFNELVNGADSIRSHVIASIVKDHVENHVEKIIRKVNTDLTASTRDGIDDLH